MFLTGRVTVCSRKPRAPGGHMAAWRRSVAALLLRPGPSDLPVQGWWAITGFAKRALATPFLPLGFLCVRDPR